MPELFQHCPAEYGDKTLQNDSVVLAWRYQYESMVGGVRVCTHMFKEHKELCIYAYIL